jgi:hypothetical protein
MAFSITLRSLRVPTSTAVPTHIEIAFPKHQAERRLFWRCVTQTCVDPYTILFYAMPGSKIQCG